jgi:hypothetical protein
MLQSLPQNNINFDIPFSYGIFSNIVMLDDINDEMAGLFDFDIVNQINYLYNFSVISFTISTIIILIGFLLFVLPF